MKQIYFSLKLSFFFNSCKSSYIEKPSQLELQNAPTVFLQRGKTLHPTCVWSRDPSSGALENVKYPFVAIAPSPNPLWPGVGASDRVLSMGQIELFNHLSV